MDSTSFKKVVKMAEKCKNGFGGWVLITGPLAFLKAAITEIKSDPYGFLMVVGFFSFFVGMAVMDVYFKITKTGILMLVSFCLTAIAYGIYKGFVCDKGGK